MLTEDVPDAFNEGWPNFFKADNLDELAEKMGIDAKGLSGTVSKYNMARITQHDDFGRTHMPLPIEKGPFYGLHLQSWFLTTYAGLAVGKDLQVIKQDGSPVGGLYAAGRTPRHRGHERPAPSVAACWSRRPSPSANCWASGFWSLRSSRPSPSDPSVRR